MAGCTTKYLSLRLPLRQRQTQLKQKDMIAIVYWNIRKGKGKDISKAIIELATATVANASVAGPNGEVLICFSEPGKVDFKAILSAINGAGTGKNWWVSVSTLGRFVVLGTVAQQQLAFDSEIKGSMPCTLTRGTSSPLTYELWFVHFPAPIHIWEPSVLLLDAAREFRQSVQDRENFKSHSRSLAIGDFNMAPFSCAMVAPTGLNATSCSSVAATVNKKINKTDTIQYFYNPMWPLLGSWATSRQPGSFYRTDKTTAQQWHLIDQVLLRPSLIKSVQLNTPVVLSMAGTIPLTKSNGRIAEVSDHLPVLITLNI